MQKHNIQGWNIYYEQKKDAPPIFSARILIKQNSIHRISGFCAMYMLLLRQFIHKESLRYSLAGTPFVSWSRTHIIIGIHSLEEDLYDFIQLIQTVLAKKPTKKMLDEERNQQYKLDIWNAGQPQELLTATFYEQFYGQTHPLGTDIDGTWRDRELISLSHFESLQLQNWDAKLVLVSRMAWKDIQSQLKTALLQSHPISSYPYPLPTTNWKQFSIPCTQAEQVGFSISIRARKKNDPLERATQIGAMALAGMFHSRMNKKLRQTGVSYGVDCHYISQKNFGRVDFSCFSQPETAEQTYDMMQKTIIAAHENWTSEEIEIAKNQLIRMEKLRWETCAQQTTLRTHQLLDDTEFVSLHEQCSQWQQVSIEHVVHVMQEISEASQLVICIGQEQNITPFAFQHAPIPQKYTFPTNP